MFTTGEYARQSIYYQKFRSIMFFLFVFIASTCLLGTWIFTESIQKGIRQAQSYLDTDIIATPSGYGEDAQDALFKGEADTILFENTSASEFAHIEGVEAASPQLYFESLKLECCTAAGVQLIAVDTDTDFVVRGLSGGENIPYLKKNEVIVGSVIGLAPGNTITLYGRKMTVAGKLKETGTGYDTAVFISYETANDITTDPEYEDIFMGQDNLASIVMIKVMKDYEISAVKQNIIKALSGKDINVYTMDSMIGTLLRQLSYFKLMGNIMSGFVILLAAVALFTLITIMFDQQKRGVGSLVSVGVSRACIIKIYLMQYTILTILGTSSGIVLVAIFLAPLHDIIKQFVDMPYKFIGILRVSELALITFGTNMAIVLVASSLSFYRVMKMEPAYLAGELG